MESVILVSIQYEAVYALFRANVVFRSGQTNEKTIKTTTQFLEKYTSHFIWKGCAWEGVGDWTELQHIDPHSYGHQCFFPVLLMMLNRRPGGLLSWVLASSTSLITNGSGLQKLTDFLSSPSSIAHSISHHNWPSECVTSTVLGMASLIVIKRK